MGFGGGAPSVEQAPEKQQTKALSAGANAAAQAQQDKAKKNRGLTSAILQNRSNAGAGGLSSNTGGSQTLGA